ncbi:MAG: hypothetical protein KJO82_08990 [Gammaproteobacteria bacterium]|nr:hypothetical protein [Gammaproteobacteria bacterium]
MSNERTTDDDVSRTYRDIANERTPERLNDAILQQAAKAARPSYARSIRWTRPLAWAATITLCLALTLQFTRLPTPDSVVLPTPAASPAKREVPETDAGLRQDEPAVSADAELHDSDSSGAFANDVKPLRMDVQDKEIVERARQMSQARSGALAEAVTDAPADDAEQKLSAASAVADTAAMSAALPAEAEAEAREAAGVAHRAADRVAEPLKAQLEEQSEPDGCDDDAKSEPERWQACIDDLEAAGRKAEAKRQRDLKREAFPDIGSP